jgi:transposase
MIINLSKQAQQCIGKSELIIIIERVDDVALLLAQMMKMGLPDILDRHLPKLPKEWQQEGLSWGWTAVIWLAYISRFAHFFRGFRHFANHCIFITYEIRLKMDPRLLFTPHRRGRQICYQVNSFCPP